MDEDTRDGILVICIAIFVFVILPNIIFAFQDMESRIEEQKLKDFKKEIAFKKTVGEVIEIEYSFIEDDIPYFIMNGKNGTRINGTLDENGELSFLINISNELNCSAKSAK